MKIVTWNINSITSRLDHLERWVQANQPDVVLLQELKCIEEKFPSEPLEDMGYNLAIYGQKTYNGVAILSKYPLEDVRKGIDSDDSQARYIEAFTGGVRVASLYAPNGEAVGSEKFAYKLAFYEKLFQHVQSLLELEEKFVVGGDYNIAPYDEDVSPLFKAAGDQVLYSNQERKALFKLYNVGMIDAIQYTPRTSSCGSLTPAGSRNPHVFQYTPVTRPGLPNPQLEFQRVYTPFPSTGSAKEIYTWWDYRGGSWEQNKGMRIDHLLLSPQAADQLKNAYIDSEPRSWDRPSDHAPVICELL